MDISTLQKARYQYKPKLPKVFTLPVDKIALRKGENTESTADQRDLKQLFKNTYGRPVVEFVEGESTAKKQRLNVGVVLSGGQAPGGPEPGRNPTV